MSVHTRSLLFQVKVHMRVLRALLVDFWTQLLNYACRVIRVMALILINVATVIQPLVSLVQVVIFFLQFN